MKKLLLLFSLLVSFSYGFSQHAVNVKKSASAMLQADEQKDYDTYVSYFYPSELKRRGGKATFIQQIQTNERQAKPIGFSPGKQTLGKVSKIYKAGKELHCTIEWIRRTKGPEGTLVNRSHFLAISADQGTTWKFIMTGGKTPAEVRAMVPKFNEGLTWVDTYE
ncbi:hypothetical protein DBR43_04780 [Pedobacter sp. KBW06]|uniref:hypothetical protein n=1 Tax=Pedobacter sp. KBW06 TaxID=2153359 RepID=UPI000F5A6CD6|nr:hypothetical protein [Pedobacter sp. KBW06]RQO74704.1 hypothetical protein DBR43_04780 [Pedobacter sp. KBW06]